MLHGRNRLSSPPTISRITRGVRIGTTNYWRSTKQYYSTVNINEVRESVLNANPSQLKNIWDRISIEDKPTALSLRTDFYSKLRENGLNSPESYWASVILNSIPKRITRYADYLFVTELLINQKQWHLLGSLLASVAKHLPSIWEQSFLQLVSTAGTDFPLEINLKVLFESCLEMKIDFAQLNRTLSSPIVDIVQIILSKYDDDEVISTVESIAETNSLQASTSASGSLRAISESIVDTEAPPTLLDLAGKDDAKMTSSNLPARLWNIKSKHSCVNSDDLKVYMMFLIYKRRPRHALSLYDNMPGLQTPGLNEAVLSAASGAGDLDRLQAEFEKVERNPALIQELGGQRYAIVLEALGFVGDAGILEDTFKTLSTWHSDLRTRGVYHAMIYSQGLRGDIKNTLRSYEMLLKAQIQPTMSTFSLISKVYRDARDLSGFISFLGNEVIAKYQLPLRNKELSMASSLCAKRRDYMSAEYIWRWANGLLKPDQLSWNAYLNCFIVTNQFDKMWQIFRKMESRKMIGIDTLTTILGSTCRYPDRQALLEKILKKQESLELEPDETWYTTYLSVLAELGSLPKFEEVFTEMKTSGISLNASHYALYTELLAKTKNFSKHQQSSREMKNRRVPISFAFIEKYLYLLTAPGSSPESRRAAKDAAFALVKEGYFDPWSDMVPRGAIPVKVIKPVVRQLSKSKQYLTARRSSDSLHQQRANADNLIDDYALWASYMEVALSSNSISVIDTLWKRFITALEKIFVLQSPGASIQVKETERRRENITEQDEAIDVISMKTLPEYAVSRRFRFEFSRQINIRVHQLLEDRALTKLLEFPSESTRLGLSMNNRNLNKYIQALASAGLYTDAFETTRRAKKQGFLSLDSFTVAKLGEGASSVKLSDYGALGDFLQKQEVSKS